MIALFSPCIALRERKAAEPTKHPRRQQIFAGIVHSSVFGRFLPLENTTVFISQIGASNVMLGTPNGHVYPHLANVIPQSSGLTAESPKCLYP